MVLMTIIGMGSFAQAQTISKSASAAATDVPITRLLAIGTVTNIATPAALKLILPMEMRETARLYLAGKIDQWYFTPDSNGVVFILNVTDIKEATELLGALPLGRAGLMEFHLIRLAPLRPLSELLPAPSN